MPEPTTSTAVTLVGHAVAVPVLTAFGMSLGLRADFLLAGFCGSVAAMALLNTVPSTGDDWRNLLNDSVRRLLTALASALFAAYAAPLLALLNGVPPALLLSVAFVAGAGAQRGLAGLVVNTRTAPPPAPKEEGKQP